ncbi:MAG: oxygenase MpaB family protein [Pseudomonadota bacterium]
MLHALRTRLHGSVENRLDAAAQAFLADPRIKSPDFSQPPGEPSLTEPNSISWRIFKNPVTLFIGGVAAVFLELAEPRVRTGVWKHSNFRRDPVLRMKRTGMAAMVTVYGAQSEATRLIAHVRRMHDRVEGVTSSGAPYAANDPALLNWVQATAAFGFLQAHHVYVGELTAAERNRYYLESERSATLYGATGAPQSLEQQSRLFAEMLPLLEPSDIIFEFRNMMRRVQAFPPPAHIFQRTLVRAAIDILPTEIRVKTGLDERYGMRPFERQFVERAARRAERYLLRSSPAVQACRRLGLPDDYLYQAELIAQTAQAH